MRTTIAAALFIAFMLVVSPGQAQTKRIYTGGDSLTATTTWVKYQRPVMFDRILGFALDHDGGTGNLWVGFGTDFVADTASGKRIVVKPYETISWGNLSIDALWIRSTAGTIPFRLRYW